MTAPSPLPPILHQPAVVANDRTPAAMQGSFAAGFRLASRSRPVSTRNAIEVAASLTCAVLGSVFRRLAGRQSRSVRHAVLSYQGTPHVVVITSCAAYPVRVRFGHLGLRSSVVEEHSTTGALGNVPKVMGGARVDARA